MRARTFLTGAASVALFALPAHAESLRYRGDYTYGHEVNIFCPQLNSQCYWLSGDSPDEIRGALETLAAQNSPSPYQAHCIVVEAEVDRGTERTGFAADYDGLITVTKLYGRCDETGIVTQGDLQHHRWVLESINGEELDVAAMDGRIPELDFGEQMYVSGNSGCNQFSGQAVLDETYIRFSKLISTLMSCSPEQNDVEGTIQTVISGTDIEINISRNCLMIKANKTSLRYRLEDWLD